MKITVRILKKLAALVLGLLVLSVLVFTMSRLAPTDPLQAYYGDRTEKMSAAEKEAALYAQQQQQAARQQADKLLSDARSQAEQEGKRILAQANRDAVSLVESAMDKLADRQTGQAYDTFLAAAGEESHHEQHA